ELDAPIVGDLKNDGEGNGLVDGAKHARIQVFGARSDAEDLDLGHACRGRQVDRFGRQVVGTADLLHVTDEQVLQGGAGAGVLVDLVLWDHAPEGGCPGPVIEDVHRAHARPPSTTRKAMSSKSSSPRMVWVRALVRPPLKRLSMSFSSFTSIMEWMALVSRSE